MKKIKNYLRINIKGLNQDKFINQTYKKIPLYDIKKIDYNILEFKVELKNEKKIKSIIKNNNYEITKINYKGIKYYIRKILFNFGFIAGLAVIIAFIAFSSNLFINTKIIGNETISVNDINNKIEELGIRKYSNIKSINTSQLENDLLVSFDKLSFVSIIKQGNYLIINIKEKVISEYTNSEFKPLVATCDGKITKIDYKQGTLNVKIGDIVKKGDILVYPYVVDSSNVKREIKAMANIEANVWITSKTTYNENALVMKQTGKIFEDKILSICGINLSSSKQCGFSKFEFKKYEKIISNFLPIKIEKTVYYEVVEQVNQIKFVDIEDIEKEKCKQIALLNITDCDIINRETYSIKNAGGIYNITCVLEISKEIGGYES